MINDCWRCDSGPAREPLGLCDDCYEILRLEHTKPATGTLHARGTLPEEIPDYTPSEPGWTRMPTETARDLADQALANLAASYRSVTSP